MTDEATNSFLHSLCEHAGIAIIATDSQFVIRFWNAAAEKMFGTGRQEAVGQPIWIIVPPERHALAQRLLDRAVERGETSEIELRRTGPDGRKHYLAVTISPIRGQEDNLDGVSVCVRDVTKGMELLRDVSETQRMSALGAMAGAVAHHFNNLLGGALTALDFVQDTGDPQMLRRGMKTALTALTRVGSLTHSLMTFAEGDHSATTLSDATDTVRRYVSRKQGEWARQGLDVQSDIRRLDARVPEKRLVTILDVLTTNACEAMSAGGTIRIELVRGPGTTIILRTIDTGVGIFEEQVRHVFEPFFTTKQAVEPGDQEHLGLGLAVVYGIVKDLGGTITLGPASGGGTLCTVCLPAVFDAGV